MRIAAFVKTSTVDYPGCLSAVVFTAGCNYDCFFCHNRHLLSTGAAAVREEELFSFLGKRRGMLDGVVISGGEPTLHAELPRLISDIKALGYGVKLDTNGSNPFAIKQLLNDKLIDYLAVDYKAPWYRYREICGGSADPEAVKATIATVLDMDVILELRTVAIPTISADEYIEMARDIPHPHRYRFSRYRAPELFNEKDRERVHLSPVSQEKLESIRAAVREIMPGTIVE